MFSNFSVHTARTSYISSLFKRAGPIYRQKPRQGVLLLLGYPRQNGPLPPSSASQGPVQTADRVHSIAEGIVRGHKGGLLKATDYQSLSQCENLEDIKMNLAGTDYSSYLQNEAGPMRTSVIVDRCMLVS